MRSYVCKLSSAFPYVGCFVDERARDLEVEMGEHDDNSPAVCAALCSDYAYFGLQYSTECYCSAMAPDNEERPASECSRQCPGDAHTACGGSWRNSVYQTLATAFVPPRSGVDSWMEFGGSVYRAFTEEPLAWADAEAACQTEGGHLASIGSQEENSFVRSLVPDAFVWIGLHEPRDEGTDDWQWSDGSSLVCRPSTDSNTCRWSDGSRQVGRAHLWL